MKLHAHIATEGKEAVDEGAKEALAPPERHASLNQVRLGEDRGDQGRRST